MKIQKAKPKDYKKIAKLRKDTFEKINGNDYTKKQIKEINEKNPPKRILEKMKKRDMFCLVEKNKILGVIDLEKNKIGGFFINHNKIGQGYGKKLLIFIEEYAKKKGIKKTILYSTKYACPFYVKHGYKLKKKDRGIAVGQPSNTYFMEKKII